MSKEEIIEFIKRQKGTFGWVEPDEVDSTLEIIISKIESLTFPSIPLVTDEMINQWLVDAGLINDTLDENMIANKINNYRRK